VPAPLDNPAACSLAEKVTFLSGTAAYPDRAAAVTPRETHMSWVFLVGDKVYKLKKPVRLPYLDFSTLALREAACREEFDLNQRLAPGVYEAVVPLVRTETGLAIGGSGEVVDWLVRMRRLDENRTLESRLAARDLGRNELDAQASALAGVYRGARRVHVASAAHLARWRASVLSNVPVLLDRRLGLPAGQVRAILSVQFRFLRIRHELLGQRARAGRILDAHGDLRPEHIWIGPPIRIIDRLEFNPGLRAIDPVDELAFLDVETKRYGAPAVGTYMRRRVLAALHERPPQELYLFYRSYRAMLRARLAIAHLLEPNPRTPEKWPRQARAYLRFAALDARRMAVLLSVSRTPRGR
jgi:aminoglycoside phosphotransferase family enzyme